MSSPKIPKTNAARILEGLQIPFELRVAEVDESDLSAVTMAGKLGVDPACVFKTLVAKGDKTGVLMAWAAPHKPLLTSVINNTGVTAATSLISDARPSS